VFDAGGGEGEGGGAGEGGGLGGGWMVACTDSVKGMPSKKACKV